jgi:hypothetical protein
MDWWWIDYFHLLFLVLFWPFGTWEQIYSKWPPWIIFLFFSLPFGTWEQIYSKWPPWIIFLFFSLPLLAFSYLRTNLCQLSSFKYGKSILIFEEIVNEIFVTLWVVGFWHGLYSLGPSPAPLPPSKPTLIIPIKTRVHNKQGK